MADNWWEEAEIVDVPAMAPALGFIPGRAKAPDPLALAANARAEEASNRAAGAEARAIASAAREEAKFAERNNPKLVKDPKVTEGERTAEAFYVRAANALKGYGKGIAPRGPVTQTLVNMLPDGIVNDYTSPERQVADTFGNEFIAATLRKESGAAIPEPELEAQRRRYFPQPGDTPEAIAAKEKLRLTALESIRLQSPTTRPIDLGAGAVQPDAGTTNLDAAKPPPGYTQHLQEMFDKGASAEEIRAYALANKFQFDDRLDRNIAYRDAGGKGGRITDPEEQELGLADDAATRLKASIDKSQGAAGAGELLLQGAQFGLGDEAAGIGNALYNAVSSPFTDATFDPAGAYRAGRDAQRMRLDDARRTSGAGGTVAEVVGGFAGGNPGNAFAGLATLGGRVAAGVRGGATGGALAGFGYGQGSENSLLSAGGGALIGAGVGAALPVAASVVGNRVGGLRRMVGRDADLPRRIVGESLASDANTPRAVGAMLDDARGRGSPLTIADTGKNARGLLASVGRQPGPPGTIAQEAVIPRQMEQAERIGSAVRRDLGPTANLRDRGDELIAEARSAASPLYDAAYARSGASSVKLDDMATRPAFQKALRNAHGLAAEEGVDPTALGFQFSEAGDVALERVPSWQTLDYVKRGLDDVIEGSRDKTTGKLVLDEAGRATNNTRRMLIARMDAINPEYKAARAAYAGPAKMKEAMDTGAKALNRSPDDLRAEMQRFSPTEMEMYRLGLRKAVVDMLESRVDGGDKVAALIGTPKKRMALAQAFGGRGPDFDRFIATLDDEARMGLTYKSVATGSQTAERVATDATTNDIGLVEKATTSAIRGSRQGGMFTGMVGDLLEAARDAGRFGAGAAGERARESVAALLTESDPAVLRELLVAARRAAARQRVSGRRGGQRARQIGQGAGTVGGTLIGGSTKQPAN